MKVTPFKYSFSLNKFERIPNSAIPEECFLLLEGFLPQMFQFLISHKRAPELLFSEKKYRELTLVRVFLNIKIREQFPTLSLQNRGSLLGGRDHTSVRHMEVNEERYKTDPFFPELLSPLGLTIQSLPLPPKEPDIPVLPKSEKIKLPEKLNDNALFNETQVAELFFRLGISKTEVDAKNDFKKLNENQPFMTGSKLRATLLFLDVPIEKVKVLGFAKA
jgi:hypothetical protein